MPEISDENLVVCISSMPPSLLKKIDRIAAQENRNRSNMIVVLLTEIVRTKLQPDATT